jgi:hypothetical protein
MVVSTPHCGGCRCTPFAKNPQATQPPDNRNRMTRIYASTRKAEWARPPLPSPRRSLRSGQRADRISTASQRHVIARCDKQSADRHGDALLSRDPMPRSCSTTGFNFPAPSSPALAGRRSNWSRIRREYRLRIALQSVKGKYDYVLVDCLLLGLLTVNGLVAATGCWCRNANTSPRGLGRSPDHRTQSGLFPETARALC